MGEYLLVKEKNKELIEQSSQISTEHSLLNVTC